MRHRTLTHIALLLAPALWLLPDGARGGSPTTFENLKVGQVVSVDGRPAGARAVLARIIEIEPGHDHDKLKGRIDAISTGDKSFMMLGVKVVTAPGTLVADRDGRAVSLSTLKKGSVVKAKGQLREDGTLHAAEIKLGNPAADEAEVQGKIQVLDTARRTLTVCGLTIRVTPTTRITVE